MAAVFYHSAFLGSLSGAKHTISPEGILEFGRYIANVPVHSKQFLNLALEHVFPTDRGGAPYPRNNATRLMSLPVRGEAVNVFGGRPLGIFKPSGDYQSGPRLDTWEQCSSRELKLAFTHPPRNIWDQMIQWTDKGILWKFPIDNEQGLEKEQEISFVDHIFLDVHLEDWCPKRGPIRNYMDLVCIGLSRNHWLSVEEKKDHIMWYREYFQSKKDLIKELGAGEFVEPAETSATL